MAPQLQLQRVEERTLTDRIYNVLDGRERILGAVAGELHLEKSDRVFEYRGSIPLIGERGSRPLTDVIYRVNIEDGQIQTTLVANGLKLAVDYGRTENHEGIIGEETMLLLYQDILAGNYHPLVFASANGALINQATSLERGEILTLDRLPLLSQGGRSIINLSGQEYQKAIGGAAGEVSTPSSSSDHQDGEEIAIIGPAEASARTSRKTSEIMTMSISDMAEPSERVSESTDNRRAAVGRIVRQRNTALYERLIADGDATRFDPASPVVEEGKMYIRNEVFSWVEKEMNDSGLINRLNAAATYQIKKGKTGYRRISDERTASRARGVSLIEGGELVRLLTSRKKPITLISLESAVGGEVAVITEKTVVKPVSKFSDERRATVRKIINQRNNALSERLVADGDALRFNPSNPVVREGEMYIRNEVFSWVEKKMNDPGLINRLNVAAAYQIKKGNTGYKNISDERTMCRVGGVSLIEGGELVRLLTSRKNSITLISLESAVTEATVEAPVPPPEAAPTSFDPRLLDRGATVPSAPVKLTREEEEEFGLSCYEISFHPLSTYKMGSVMRELHTMTQDIATSRRLLEMARQDYGQRNGRYRKIVTPRTKLTGKQIYTLLTERIRLDERFVRQITLEDEEAST